MSSIVHSNNSNKSKHHQFGANANNSQEKAITDTNKHLADQKEFSSNNYKKTITLHDPDFDNVVTVPMSAVHHLPAAHHKIARLVQCRKYDPRNPLLSCPLRQKCKFVHADLTAIGVETQTVHVNYVYHSLQDVSFPRLPAGRLVTVVVPQGSSSSEGSGNASRHATGRFVPSEEVLVTTGARRKGPLRHCAHYYFNRCCDRGERCQFVHTVHIDPTAAQGPPSRRAPAPKCHSENIDRSGPSSVEAPLSPFERASSLVDPRRSMNMEFQQHNERQIGSDDDHQTTGWSPWKSNPPPATDAVNQHRGSAPESSHLAENQYHHRPDHHHHSSASQELACGSCYDLQSDHHYYSCPPQNSGRVGGVSGLHHTSSTVSSSGLTTPGFHHSLCHNANNTNISSSNGNSSHFYYSRSSPTETAITTTHTSGSPSFAIHWRCSQSGSDGGGGGSSEHCSSGCASLGSPTQFPTTTTAPIPTTVAIPSSGDDHHPQGLSTTPAAAAVVWYRRNPYSASDTTTPVTKSHSGAR